MTKETIFSNYSHTCYRPSAHKFCTIITGKKVILSLLPSSRSPFSINSLFKVMLFSICSKTLETKRNVIYWAISCHLHYWFSCKECLTVRGLEMACDWLKLSSCQKQNLRKEFACHLFIWELVLGNSGIKWKLRIEAWNEASKHVFLNRLFLWLTASPSAEFSETLQNMPQSCEKVDVLESQITSETGWNCIQISWAFWPPPWQIIVSASWVYLSV